MRCDHCPRSTSAQQLYALICAVAPQIHSQDGLGGFYRGCMTNLLRTTPAAALTFTSFELIARELRKLGAAQRAAQAEQQGVVST